LLCILTLSATTSFVDFPRLCRMVAEDGFLPRPFAIAGRRLAFTVGIVYLAVTAGALLFAFDGITDRLIPLYAIGAFLTFTMSQAGMVIHWRRSLRKTTSKKERAEQQAHFVTNAVGAVATGSALGIIIIAKFAEGAWITLLAIPAVIVLLRLIHRYYQRLTANIEELGPLKLDDTRPPILLVTLLQWSKLTEKALKLALTLSPDVIGLHLAHLAGPQAEEHGKKLRDEWHTMVEQPCAAAGLSPPRLVVLPAEYRSIHEPILKFARELETHFPGRRLLVLVPEVVREHWYQYLLHAGYANQLRKQLLRNGGSHITVLSVPWRLGETDNEEVTVPNAAAPQVKLARAEG